MDEGLAPAHRGPDRTSVRVELDAVGARIAAARRDRDPAVRDALVELLRASHPVHRGRAAADVVRQRARVMHAFGELGLPAAAVPFVLEELETGDHAEALVAAAVALRGGTPSAALLPLLDQAMANVRGRDEYVSFDTADAVGAPGAGTTARDALAATRTWIEAQAAAGCCAPALGDEAAGVVRVPVAARVAPGEVAAIELEDQDGVRRTFAARFVGRPTVVAFFYTRCENPRKCSLTIAKLARVRQRLDRRGLGARVGVAAITYDGEHDTPARLKAYGAARGLAGGDAAPLLRVSGDDGAVLRHFGCEVGKVGAAVSRHRLELVVLDAAGRVAATFAHRAWDEDRVADEAAALVGGPAGGGGGVIAAAASSLAGALPAIGLTLLPKCPMCWAAYAGAFGIAGLEVAGPWAKPVLALLVVLNVALAWRRARRFRRYVPFALTAAGAAAIVLLGIAAGVGGAIAPGVALTVLGAVLVPLFARARRAP